MTQNKEIWSIKGKDRLKIRIVIGTQKKEKYFHMVKGSNVAKQTGDRNLNNQNLYKILNILPGMYSKKECQLL